VIEDRYFQALDGERSAELTEFDEAFEGVLACARFGIKREEIAAGQETNSFAHDFWVAGCLVTDGGFRVTLESRFLLVQLTLVAGYAAEDLLWNVELHSSVSLGVVSSFLDLEPSATAVV
jgi:head-tail adaptor